MAEIVFAQLHPTFSYEPTIFRINGTKYIPDFYDPKENCFYEIIGSRQRFEQLKNKLRKFRECYPEIKLIVCFGDGKPYHSTKNSDVVSTPDALATPNCQRREPVSSETQESGR